MAAKRNAWDQQEGESEANYLLFLVYRDMGPDRSLLAAWLEWLTAQGKPVPQPSGNKRLTPPGNWIKASTRHEWVKRARLWDLQCFATDGQDAVLLTFRYIRQLASRGLKALDKREAEPGSEAWKSHLETVKDLVSLIPDETVADLVRCRDDSAGDEPEERSPEGLPDGPGSLCPGPAEDQTDRGSGDDPPAPDNAAESGAGS